MGIRIEEFDNCFDSSKIDVKKNNELEYIKDIIRDGVRQCKEKTECIDNIIKDLHIYEPLGIDPNLTYLLEELKYKFEVIGPAILAGDYNQLLQYEDNNSDEEEILNIYKSVRKKLINNLKNNKQF